MQAELSVALNFIISHLYNKLPRRRVDVFREELQRGFELRFVGHWYPDEPTKGSGFRCVKLAADKVDPVVDAAAKASGLDIGEIKSYLPAGLTIWIDPREVSCRLTENGPVKVIYRGGGGGVGTLDQTQGTLCNVDGDEMTPDRELQRVNWGYDPSPSPGWSSTGGSGSGASPVAGGTARVLHPPPPNTTCFTAATFAQTKFGSTKMKSQTGPQRPNRLSPIESLPTGFTPRLSPSSGCWGLSPTSGLSPTVGTNRLSPMQQSPTVQFGMLSTAGGGDARLAGLQEWLLLQHHQHQQMQYMAALKHQQQQQQQQRGMTSSASHQAVARTSTNIRLTSPHLSLRHHLQLQQLHPSLPPQPQHGFVVSPDVGLFPDPDASLQEDGVGLSPADCVDWNLDVTASGYTGGLQQLLLAN